MPTNILMPALSPTMEKGNLAKWHVKEGDKVASGDVIAEIETDKATMEVEAVDEGTIGKIMIAEGTQDIAVNAVIAVLLGEGERPGGPAAAAAGAEDRGAALPVAAPRGGTTPADEAAPSPSPQPAKGKAEPTPGPAAAEAGRPGQPANGGRAGGRVVASPLARRLAGVAGIDLSGLKGSGPRGRIVSADVAAAQKSGAVVRTAEQRAQAAPAVTPPPSDAATLRMFADGAYDLVPHDGMRKTIARRLLQSKQTIPHFYLTADVELDALLALRKDVNDAAPKDKDGNPAFRISVNDFVIKALALALRAIPDANVSWTDAAMVRHKVVDVGVAVSIPGGLITPVVRRADEKTLSTIAAEMKDLAKRARDRKLKPAEYEGGSTAVSNLGMYGVKDFAAIVNPPHATILAVGAGEERAVARKGALAVATVMSCTLSTDHRAVDGALGAELMQAFKALIEKPVRMLV